MMIAHGRLFLAKTAPLATVAADGTFNLTLLAFDRIGAHQVEPWRITHSGLGAQLWWKCYQAELTAGVSLYVELERIRTFIGPRGPEFHAAVRHISLSPLSCTRLEHIPATQAA